MLYNVIQALSLKSELDQYARSQREKAGGSRVDGVPVSSEWEPRADAVLDFRIWAQAIAKFCKKIAVVVDVQPAVAGEKGKGNAPNDPCDACWRRDASGSAARRLTL